MGAYCNSSYSIVNVVYRVEDIKVNHKWQNNICVKCGVQRERRLRRLLMAIVNHPPWNVFKNEVLYWYGEKNGFKRPECPIELTTDAESDTTNPEQNYKKLVK